MILAVPAHVHARLNAVGELEKICEEIRERNIPALRTRVARRELVQSKDAVKHAEGERDRCYMPDCGGEATVCYRRRDKAHYFRHMTNPVCIGDPANPAGAKQR